MSDKDGHIVDSAEAAIFSIQMAKDNIEKYLSLHGLKPSVTGEVGKSAEFNMGNISAKTEFASVINKSLELPVHNIEKFIASQGS